MYPIVSSLMSLHTSIKWHIEGYSMQLIYGRWVGGNHGYWSLYNKAVSAENLNFEYYLGNKILITHKVT